MALFSVDNGSHVHSSVGHRNDQPYLIITTNIINDKLLQSVDILVTKNIIFQVPLGIFGPARNNNFDFQVDLHNWSKFSSKIHYLEFRGVLVSNQFTAKHLECMVSLKGLYFGSTDYKLFDDEDISNLPILTCLSLNGYGMVHQSQNMQIWLEKNTKNGCEYNYYV